MIRNAIRSSCHDLLSKVFREYKKTAVQRKKFANPANKQAICDYFVIIRVLID